MAELAAFARTALLDLPTPLAHLERLSDLLDADIRVKRDDLGATGLGGNKLRKLEFLLGEALATGCDTIVTFGALQSNHARQTAASCARLGLDCHLLLTRAVRRDDDLYLGSGNVLLDQLFGARLWVCDDDAALARSVETLDAELTARAARARWIPPGGSEPIGALGYVAAAGEIVSQISAAGLPGADLVLATSTGGTQAGLLAGLRMSDGSAPAPALRVRGVAVHAGAAQAHEAITLLDAGVSELLGIPPAEPGQIDVDDSQLGAGYGLTTAGSTEAMRLFATYEGIVLDPVYTAKAAAGLIAGCRSGELGSDRPVVFLHTGGSPALFSYGQDAFS